MYRALHIIAIACLCHLQGPYADSLTVRCHKRPQAFAHGADHISSNAGAAAAGTAASHATASASGRSAGVAAWIGNSAPVRALRDGAGALLSRMARSRLGQRLLTPAFVSRAARGVMVAVPAIGALFVYHMAKQDLKRYLQVTCLAFSTGNAIANKTAAFMCEAVQNVLPHGETGPEALPAGGLWHCLSDECNGHQPSCYKRQVNDAHLHNPQSTIHNPCTTSHQMLR